MSTTKPSVRAATDAAVLADSSSTFRIYWYRCNICSKDFEDVSPSHRKRLHLLLEHKQAHREHAKNL
jgi:hypothetical protein